MRNAKVVVVKTGNKTFVTRKMKVGKYDNGLLQFYEYDGVQTVIEKPRISHGKLIKILEEVIK